jgi:N6-L-threonylcarbamoyladenine synthase
MQVLGIETSCDETAAAVVRDGRRVLSNVVFSQVSLHRPYGGVVPEIASRNHVRVLPGVLAGALEQAGQSWDAIDSIAVTYGPGLSSSLLVGLATAKGLALATGKPLCAVNHLQAHAYSPFLADGSPSFEEACPFIALVVSGGHTCLLRVDASDSMFLLGQTIDDAAGEAFDKGANLLQLGYPGGPAIDRIAANGDPAAIAFPRGRASKKATWIDGMASKLCFSFSGLKTALLYHLKANPLVDGDKRRLADVAASYQEAIIDALVDRTAMAMANHRTLVVGGGVSLNRRLRARLTGYAATSGIRLLMADGAYCGDNAAMIAGLAGNGQGVWGAEALRIDAEPNLPVAAIGKR